MVDKSEVDNSENAITVKKALYLLHRLIEQLGEITQSLEKRIAELESKMMKVENAKGIKVI